MYFAMAFEHRARLTSQAAKKIQLIPGNGIVTV